MKFSPRALKQEELNNMSVDELKQKVKILHSENQQLIHKIEDMKKKFNFKIEEMARDIGQKNKNNHKLKEEIDKVK